MGKQNSYLTVIAVHSIMHHNYCQRTIVCVCVCVCERERDRERRVCVFNSRMGVYIGMKSYNNNDIVSLE